MKMIERRYFHYEDLEEFKYGMWRIERGVKRKKYIKLSEELMKDINEFKKSMSRSIKEWPNSVLHNLTVVSANRLAWLGHAGCCIKHKSPEECTRAAWHLLTDDERNEANRAALEVLVQWEISSPGLQRDLFR